MPLDLEQAVERAIAREGSPFTCGCGLIHISCTALGLTTERSAIRTVVEPQIPKGWARVLKTHILNLGSCHGVKRPTSFIPPGPAFDDKSSFIRHLRCRANC